MDNCSLTCNIIKCRKELKKQATVTICSHIFCMEHGQNASDMDKCPACGQVFTEKYDVVVTDLHPSEEHKAMVLTGLSPDNIMDICTKALTFWNYQMYQDKLYKDALIKNAKQHAAELVDYSESQIAKFNLEMQKLQRSNELLKKEIEEKNQQIYELNVQLAEKSKLHKNMQKQFEYMRRKQVNHFVTTDEEPYSPAYFNSSDNDMRSYPRQYVNRSSGKRENVPNQPESDFVFQPRM